MIRIRAALASDEDAIWLILEPTIRNGETYALPRDMSREGEVAGTYCLRRNQAGGGSHVANCGYMTAPAAAGKGVASAMCAHSLEMAAKLGFRAMQFNFVVSTNERAVKLWQRFGFDIVGRLPGAFLHPTLGYVDAYVMFRQL